MHRTRPAPSALFIENRSRLRALLEPGSLVILHSNDVMPTNADGILGFKQNTDLFWLTGIDQEETILVIFPDAVEETNREILFVRETTPQIAVWEGKKLDKGQATELSGIKQVRWTSDFPGLLRALMLQARQVYLSTNEHARAVAEVRTRNDRFIRECRESFPLHRYERLAPLITSLRMVKSPAEIPLLREAARITGDGFRRVLGYVRPGVGEWEIEAELAHEFIRQGSRGFAYPPIIGSGKNANVLHYVSNHCRCRKGELVLLDVAAEYGNYNADLTRTIPVSGRFTRRQRDVYNAVLAILRGCGQILRPGITLKEYTDQSLEITARELVTLGLAKPSALRTARKRIAAAKAYLPHGISHHLGLDVHDVGLAGAPVAVGHCYTIEPGLYLPEEGFGIRLENDYWIGESANENLLANAPIEAAEIESLMNPGKRA